MEFGWEQCKVVNMRSGKICEDKGLLSFDTSDIMESLSNEETHNYLGFFQLNGILVQEMKEKIKSAFEKSSTQNTNVKLSMLVLYQYTSTLLE